MENKNPIWSRLWFAWVILTIAYLVLYFSGMRAGEHYQLTYLIGLFVPFGFWNGSASIEALALNSLDNIRIAIAAIFSLIVIFTGNKIINRYIGLNPILKLVLNLIILLALTALVDYAIWGSWMSSALFTTGKAISF